MEPDQKSSFDIFSSKDNFDGMASYELSLHWRDSDGVDQYVDNAKTYSDDSTHAARADLNGIADNVDNVKDRGNSTDTNTAEAYKLIVYLDTDSNPHAHMLRSLKVVVYNSEHKEILSDSVTPDYGDSHQKISPKSGYSIADKSGQHPSQIKVCAQQSGSVNVTSITHDDCFKIKQNIAKTYWYSVFDWDLIDGWKAAD